MNDVDFILIKPPVSSSDRIEVLSTDAQPTVATDGTALDVGVELRETDTGKSYYWTGSAWAPTAFQQKFDQLIEATIETRDLLRWLIAANNEGDIP